MTLGELLKGWAEVAEQADRPLVGLTADSRQVEPGWLFVALPFIDRPGFKFDGHAFIPQAVQNGAAAIVATDPAAYETAGEVPVILVRDSRWLLPRLASRWYGEPSRELRLVGVTGTNGKTTTTYLLEAIFQAAGWKTVLAGTVETRLAGERRPATTTTPDPVSLQRLWREAAEGGVTAGAMEVSSHALDQHRVDATRFEVAIFTNLTQDHLDYHPGMEDYFAAKARLFRPDELGQVPRAVVNADDPFGRRLLEQPLHQPLSFGFGEADVRAERVEFDARGARYGVVSPAGRWEQTLRVVGRYNVSNALAATAAALAMGLPPALIGEALSAAAGAPGRLEIVDQGQPFLVLVDYAHTPDALANAIGAVRQLTTGRVITVFGCGGDRDRTKRPRMGGIASELSDVLVVTSDNPRTEPPDGIVNDILEGVDRSAAALTVEVDRAKGIAAALTTAQPGDVVLIAGKGHEDYQILGETKIHFDDREVARDWLREHG